jgi:hypothetical protein
MNTNIFYRVVENRKTFDSEGDMDVDPKEELEVDAFI